MNKPSKRREAQAKITTRQTYYNYIAVRHAYYEGKATLQELAHALALVGESAETQLNRTH